MTASIATKPEGKSAAEQSERLLRMLTLLRDGYADLSTKLLEHGLVFMSGRVAGTCQMLDVHIYAMDWIAASLNDRRPKGEDDGVRQSQGGKGTPQHQMPLLRDK